MRVYSFALDLKATGITIERSEIRLQQLTCAVLCTDTKRQLHHKNE